MTDTLKNLEKLARRDYKTLNIIARKLTEHLTYDEMEFLYYLAEKKQSFVLPLIKGLIAYREV